MKLDFHLSQDGTKIDRKTDSILDFFGDIGGLYELFRIIFGFIALPFSKIRLSAFLTSQLYHLSEKTDGIYSKIKDSTYVRGVKGSTNLQLKVPTAVSYIYLRALCCCDQQFKPWKQAVELGQENLDTEMDLVSFIRRKRMHGFALQFLTRHRDRVLSGILGYSKYLRESSQIKQEEEETPPDFADVYDWWNRDENLCG
jgi:hypothetical protein